MLAGDPVAEAGPKLGVLLAIIDFPVLAAGYRVVIDAAPDLRVAGVIDSREALRDHVARAAADIVIADGFSGTSGGRGPFRTIEEIRAGRPSARILALECQAGGDQYSLAIRAGAHGFLTREATPADVLTGIRSISRGETYVSPSIVTRMVSTYVLRSAPEASDGAFDSLSERARDVFRLAAVGHSSREIARTLNVSEQVVRNHRATIMEKLGVHGRVDLLRYGLRRGIISASEL